jgi:hypothetical protein
MVIFFRLRARSRCFASLLVRPLSALKTLFAPYSNFPLNTIDRYDSLTFVLLPIDVHTYAQRFGVFVLF